MRISGAVLACVLLAPPTLSGVDVPHEPDGPADPPCAKDLVGVWYGVFSSAHTVVTFDRDGFYQAHVSGDKVPEWVGSWKMTGNRLIITETRYATLQEPTADHEWYEYNCPLKWAGNTGGVEGQAVSVRTWISSFQVRISRQTRHRTGTWGK